MALDGPTSLFKVVGNNPEKKLLGPFRSTDTAFPCSGGPIQSSRKQSLLGSFVNVDTGFACSGRPIQSRRKHSREKPAGSILEHRCWLCMLWLAHSKQSKTISKRNYWAHSGTSIPLFPAPAGRFKAFGNIFKRNILGSSVTVNVGFARSNGPIQSSQKQLLLGPFVSVNTSFACSGGPIRSSRKYSRGETSGGPIQSSQKHSRKENNEPIHEHRCWLWMVRWAHSKQSETFSETNCWAHSGTSIPPFHAPVGPFKAVGNKLYWAHL
jgi:hypothetical protein